MCRESWPVFNSIELLPLKFLFHFLDVFGVGLAFLLPGDVSLQRLTRLLQQLRVVANADDVTTSSTNVIMYQCKSNSDLSCTIMHSVSWASSGIMSNSLQTQNHKGQNAILTPVCLRGSPPPCDPPSLSLCPVYPSTATKAKLVVTDIIVYQAKIMQ